MPASVKHFFLELRYASATLPVQRMVDAPPLTPNPSVESVWRRCRTDSLSLHSSPLLGASLPTGFRPSHQTASYFEEALELLPGGDLRALLIDRREQIQRGAACVEPGVFEEATHIIENAGFFELHSYLLQFFAKLDRRAIFEPEVARAAAFGLDALEHINGYEQIDRVSSSLLRHGEIPLNCEEIFVIHMQNDVLRNVSYRKAVVGCLVGAGGAFGAWVTTPGPVAMAVSCAGYSLCKQSLAELEPRFSLCEGYILEVRDMIESVRVRSTRPLAEVANETLHYDEADSSPLAELRAQGFVVARILRAFGTPSRTIHEAFANTAVPTAPDNPLANLLAKTLREQLIDPPSRVLEAYLSATGDYKEFSTLVDLLNTAHIAWAREQQASYQGDFCNLVVQRESVLG